MISVEIMFIFLFLNSKLLTLVLTTHSAGAHGYATPKTGSQWSLIDL